MENLAILSVIDTKFLENLLFNVRRHQKLISSRKPGIYLELNVRLGKSRGKAEQHDILIEPICFVLLHNLIIPVSESLREFITICPNQIKT